MCSVDNGIYILKCKDGYRVVHAQEIENIYWEPDDSGFNIDAIIDYFGQCNVLKTEAEAWKEAQQLYDAIMNDDYCPMLEYGVQFIKGMENHDFPKIEDEPEDCPICETPFFYNICHGCGYKRRDTI